MRRSRWFRVVVVLLALAASMLALVGAGPSGASKGAGAVRKIVIFQEGALSEAAKEALVRRFGGVAIKHLRLVDGMAVLLPPQAQAPLVDILEVVRVDDDVIVYALPKPPKPDKPGKPPKEPRPQPPEELPWGVDQIDAESAWGTSTGSGVKVAILDTGIDLEHPDLQANIAPEFPDGYNAINSRKSAKDDNGHGTHVAGTVAAVNNDVGVVGVAPQAWLYSVKVLDRRGTGWLSDIIEGLDWCIENEAQVVNMSFGSTSGNATFLEAIQAAHTAGIVLVAAAGNTYGGPVIYPAAYEEVIAVSATDSANNLAWFSSVGSEVELAAPGVNILSTVPGGGYEDDGWNGTSMASPHVAGTAALVIASPVDPEYDYNNNGLWDVEEVRTRLADTADPLGDLSKFGSGLVDAEEAATGSQT